MKRMQRLVFFASLSVLALLILLGFAFNRAVDSWQFTHQNQLIENQLSSLQLKFNYFDSTSQLKTQAYLKTSNEHELLSKQPSFAIIFDSNHHLLGKIYRTVDNVIANELPQAFMTKTQQFIINHSDNINTDCCGITSFNQTSWVMLSVIKQKERIFVLGEFILTNDPVISDIQLSKSALSILENEILKSDFLQPSSKLKVTLASTEQAALYLQPLIMVIVGIASLSVLMISILFFNYRDNPEKNLEKLKNEIARIRSNTDSVKHVGTDQHDEIGELAGSINEVLDELFAAKEFNNVILNSIGDVVITTDLKGFVTYCNAATFKMIQLSEADILGQHITNILPFTNPEDSKKLKTCLADVIRNGVDISGERHMHKLNRELELLYVEKHITLLRNQKQQSVGTVMVLRDMTQSERLRQKLNFQARYDGVTKLYNRHKYEESLNEALHSSKTDGREHILCQIDLDRFKLINDNAGHAAGDQLLYEIGTILRSFLRKTDICARIGGDEYGIILFDAQLKHGLAILEKVLEQIKHYRFLWGGKVYTIGASIGITEISRRTINAAEARREADAACYLAKNLGLNNIRVFDSNNASLSSHHQAPQWAAKINDALVNDKFELFFQRINPTVGVSEREHVEILLRMKDENGILLAPGMFLPAAERFRLTTKIDRWVIKSVFSWISSRPTIWDNVTLSVNLAGESLNDETLYSYIIELHKKINFPPEAICFEITESAAVSNLVVGRELIVKLQSYGFTFALDDFGKGFSSYSYLQNLPAEYVKIDGGFVKEMIANKRDHEIVRSIHQISSAMGMKTIAEYVEDDDILQALREIGVDYAQGFGIQKPADLAEFKPLSEILSSNLTKAQLEKTSLSEPENQVNATEELPV